MPRPAGETARYALTLGTEGDTRLAVDFVTTGTQDGLDYAHWTQGKIVPADQEATVEVPSEPGLKEVIFIVTNLAPETHDTDTSPWLGRRFHYRFTATRP
jgi:hypothetical protein